MTDRPIIRLWLLKLIRNNKEMDPDLIKHELFPMMFVEASLRTREGFMYGCESCMSVNHV